MLYRIDEKPDGYFMDVSEHAECYEVLDSRGVCAYFCIERKEDLSAFHIEVTRWSKFSKTTAIHDFHKIVEEQKRMGVRKIIASYDGDEPDKWEKFIALFGFPGARAVMLSEREI